MSSSQLSGAPRQRLPREAYISEEWLAREKKELFSRTWTFAGTVMDFLNPGDFRTVKAGDHTLFVVKGSDDILRGFHNVCRHRGTELVEDCGNAGRTIICPYHNWVYNLDGRLRGVPAQAECFPELDKKSTALFGAAVGIFRNLVFVHPDAEPDVPFKTWIDELESVAWPHDLGSQNQVNLCSTHCFPRSSPFFS